MSKKQQLLKKHRQKKRLILIGFAIYLLAWIIACFFVPFLACFIPFIIIGIWIIHEAWLADHLFYSPKQDYLYNFPANTFTVAAQLQQDTLQIDLDNLPDNLDTLFLAVNLKTSFMGHLLDPQVIIKTNQLTDRQDFERGVQGLRYINLSGLADELQQGTISISTKHCHIKGELILYGFTNPDYSQQRMMVIAPHADDAELAAFGQYSQCSDASIITLTQGEIEAEYYQQTLNLTKQEAAQLKGRLRSWDSIAIPLWGGVNPSNSVQLGYYCLQLKAMHQQPEQSFGSKESGETDTRLVRLFNSLPLPSDNDGLATWHNLKNDLTLLIEHFKPEVIIMPHPQLDPHEDHVEASLLVEEVLQTTTWQPSTQLLYANHLHDNDRWPMGPAYKGIALPPAVDPLPAYALWSPVLSKQTQLNKAMALAMEHDLQPPLSIKRRLRRLIQSLITEREHPPAGENEFFRKAVRSHELFWVKPRQ
ncbi:PIG-L family deacetylase [Entomomonas sp. E2T0]|uniref:PIG-L deacetylase family protein n=1 Tax=Entomomonas sp. E2T0 TaxID=2930213 RepID=UPI002228148A|nr:PIG-L family deacetylase [Entomomonas sp. E2T0]UYZ83223.1 PIG-L family deacetylase [Entomomonas sp. E2T0]